MEKGIWLSFDLGIQGDYDHMYMWLDNHSAVECGDSMAFLHVQIPNMMKDDEFLAFLLDDLTRFVKFKPGDRVYIIRKDEESGKYVGKFIIGRRRASPWEGRGDKGDNPIDDGSL